MGLGRSKGGSRSRRGGGEMSEMREDHQTITVTLESYGLKSEFKMPFDLLDKALFDGDLCYLKQLEN